MSEQSERHPRPASESREFGVRSPARATAGASVQRAIEAVMQALLAPTLSLDRLRRAVVRYGAVARDLALAPDEMLAALVPRVRQLLAGRPLPERGDLPRMVQWWAIHGYHRAD